MIVDEADMEMEMANDPFIEAGIEVPPNLPYQDSTQQEDSYKKVVREEPETPTTLRKTIRKLSTWTGKDSGASAIGTAMRFRNDSMTSSKSAMPEAYPSRKRTTRLDHYLVLSAS